MKRLFLLAVAGLFLLSLTANANAAYTADYFIGWGPFGSIQHFEVKNGGTSWEMASKNGATVLESENLSFASGGNYGFSLSHDSITGMMTLTMQGKSLTYDTGFGSFDHLHILSKSSNSDYISNIQDIDLFPSDGITENISTQGMKIGLTYSDTTPFADFNWTGIFNPSWTLTGPYLDAGAEMFIGWSDGTPIAATPLPGAVWLLGSGLAGLIGWRRKIRK